MHATRFAFTTVATCAESAICANLQKEKPSSLALIIHMGSWLPLTVPLTSNSTVWA